MSSANQRRGHMNREAAALAKAGPAVRSGPDLGEIADRRDSGGVTVEAAMALAVLAVVLVACLAGVACVIAQSRCGDAAREAARRADQDVARPGERRTRCIGRLLIVNGCCRGGSNHETFSALLSSVRGTCLDRWSTVCLRFLVTVY